MSTNERLGKPDKRCIDECQISWRASSFYPLSLFKFLSGKRERTAPKFWFCAHEISQNQLNISGAVSSRFTFLGSELLLFYCFLPLFIIHEFYIFLKNQSINIKGRYRYCLFETIWQRTGRKFAESSSFEDSIQFFDGLPFTAKWPSPHFHEIGILLFLVPSHGGFSSKS